MNIYQLSGIYTVDEPELKRSRPAVIKYLYSHEKNYSYDEFKSILNHLFKKYKGILAKIDEELQNKYNFEPIKPTHVSFAGGTVSKESLEQIIGQKA